MGRNKYPEETVAKILDAALELFCAQGYEGTSIQDIVDRLDGMTKGAVYHHFKSKEEIFNAAFDRAMTPIVEHRRSMLGVGNMTGAQKLKRLYAPESVVPQIELWARMRPAADPVKSSRLLAMQYQGSFDALNVWRRWLPRWDSIWVRKCSRQRHGFGTYGTVPGGNIDINGM